VRKIVILAVVATVMLSGCISGKFLGFLATSDYVDQKEKALADDQAKQIADLKAQLADYEKFKQQTQNAVDQINQFQALAKRVEGRLDQVPKEVIKQIIDALQAALNE